MRGGSVENLLIMFRDDHAVMREDADSHLGGLHVEAARGQNRAQSPLVTRESAFRGGPASILAIRKLIVHRSPILRFRRFGSVPRIDGDRRTANAEFLSAENVIVLGVVRFVGQDSSWAKVRCRLTHRRAEGGRILARPATDDGADDQVRRRVEDRRQLGPSDRRELRSPAALEIVRRSLARLQTGRVDGRGSVAVDQPALASAFAASGKERFPFFSSLSFRSTCQSVEWSGVLDNSSASRSSLHSLVNAAMPRRSVRRKRRSTSRANNCGSV